MKKCITMVLSLIIALSFSGCGSSTSVSTKNASDKQLTKLKVGYSATGGSTLTFVAQNQGFFKQQGLDVELVPFTSSADGLTAINTGKIDIGVSFGVAGPLTYISKDVDFTIIGGQLSGGHPIIARPENASKFKTIQDYKGKTIATARLYTSDVVFRGALIEAGIDPKKDLKLVEMKNPQAVLEAVKSGKVDAGVGSSSIDVAIKNEGMAIIGWSNNLFPDHPCCRIVVKGKAVKASPDTYKKFLKALIQAEKIRDEKPDLAVAANKKFLKLDDKRAKEYTLEEHLINTVDPNKNAVITMWKEMNQIKYIDSNKDISKYINTQLYKDALDELKKANPLDKFYDTLEIRFTKQNS